MLGNLLSRLLSPRLLSSIREISPSPEAVSEMSSSTLPDFVSELAILPRLYDTRMSEFQLNKATEDIMDVITKANAVFTGLEWWSPRDSNPAFPQLSHNERIALSVSVAHEALRICGILLQPIMPIKAAQILDTLGVDKDERGWKDVEQAKMGVPNVGRYVLDADKLFPPLRARDELGASGKSLSPSSIPKPQGKTGKAPDIQQ